MDTTFAVCAPAWHAPTFALLLVVGALITFRAAALQFAGSRLFLARAVLLFGVCGAAFVGFAKSRDLVRVNGETMEVIWPYTFESGRYRMQDVLWFDVQNRESGIGIRSDLRPYLLMRFSDDGYTEIPMDLENTKRLENFLRSRGVHEGVVLEE